MSFKDNLRRGRTKANLSQEDLAEKVSVSRQTVSKWENGDIYPSTKHIFMLTEALNCSFNELVGSKFDIDNQPVINLKHKTNRRNALYMFNAICCIILMIFGFTIIMNTPNNKANDHKIAVFDSVIDGSLDEAILENGYSEKEIVGYGVTEEEGLFYIKCNLYNSIDNPCSAIIYFCKNDNGYSYKCQLLDDPDYIPKGNYYKIS